ncbi:unnamed protein product [Periconia digitata]|uniref:DNA-directed RNA polymerase III subunit RPC9 n=1 Tax=Periconia digitata TaxID=1303443 RepID=A0A9W4UVY6_9PLEO|nr:unnamed protein product [Periconia digitata]
MHIKTAQSALLSNHEVLLHLQTESAEYDGTDDTNRKRRPPPGLKEILQDAQHYLTSADLPLSTLATKTRPKRPLTLYRGPSSLLRALAPKYRLNKTEYLQIYNTRPRTQVTLQLVIEEAGIRFTEEELDDMLGIIEGVFEEEEGQIEKGAEGVRLKGVGEGMVGGGVGKRRKKRGGE